MTPNDIDFPQISTILRNRIRYILPLLGDGVFHKEEFKDLAHNPEKDYMGVTQIPLIDKRGSDLGILYALVLVGGNGTGSTITYNPANIYIPETLQNPLKPTSMIPRAKDGVIAEGYIPFFTINFDGFEIPYAGSLNEILIGERNELYTGWTLGQSTPQFEQLVGCQTSTKPEVFLTVGNDYDGKRIGDPHAIISDARKGSIADLVQVAGFIATTNTNNPIYEASKTWTRPKL